MKDNGLLENLFRWSVDCKGMKLLRLVTRVKQGTAACCLKLSVLATWKVLQKRDTGKGRPGW